MLMWGIRTFFLVMMLLVESKNIFSFTESLGVQDPITQADHEWARFVYTEMIDLYSKCVALEKFYENYQMQRYFDNKLIIKSCYQIVSEPSEDVDSKWNFLQIVEIQMYHKEKILCQEKIFHPEVLLRYQNVALQSLKNLVQRSEDTLYVAYIEMKEFDRILDKMCQEKKNYVASGKHD